ncbi:hypothetical protein Tco_0187966, partial [Tanacetum coccineum]
MIGVTQPRRVVVLATTRRLTYQLGLGQGKEVSTFSLVIASNFKAL